MRIAASPSEPGEPIVVPDDVAALVSAAETLLAEADAALRNGDLATYGTKVAEATELIRRAQALIAGDPST